MFLIDWMARWSFVVFFFLFFFFYFIFFLLWILSCSMRTFFFGCEHLRTMLEKMGERDDNVLSSWEKNDRMTFYVNMKASTTYICRMLTNKNANRQKNKNTHDHKKQETHTLIDKQKKHTVMQQKQKQRHIQTEIRHIQTCTNIQTET